MLIVRNLDLGAPCPASHGSKVRVVGENVLCGHCDDLLYVGLVDGHTFRCESGVLVITEHVFGIEVHRCSQPGISIAEFTVLDLTASR